jgi:hypothetical protein
MESAPDPKPDSPVKFRYTFEEFVESQLVVEQRRQQLAAAARATSGLAPPLRVRAIGGVIGLGVFALLVALIAFHDRLPSFLTPQPGEHYFLHLGLPIFLFCATIFGVNALVRRATYRGVRLSPPPGQTRARLTAALIGLTIAAMVLGGASFEAADRSTSHELLHELYLLVAPWPIIFGCYYLASVAPWRRAGGWVKNQWDSNPHLHVEKTLELDDVWFRLTDDNARYALRWEAVECEEGDNVFVFIIGGVFYMCPKRVLSSDQVAFLRARFAPGRAPLGGGGGFPVLPADTTKRAPSSDDPCRGGTHP